MEAERNESDRVPENGTHANADSSGFPESPSDVSHSCEPDSGSASLDQGPSDSSLPRDDLTGAGFQPQAGEPPVALVTPRTPTPAGPAAATALNRPGPKLPAGKASSRTSQTDNNSSLMRELVSRVFWLAAMSGMVLVIWKIGPRIVEEYHFAATRGQMRAEYDNAVTQLANQPLQNVSQAYQLVAEKVRPSVVSINTIRPDEGTRGQGSGVIMTGDGYILTNSHVVEAASEINVYMYDRRRYSAQIVGTDDDSDLAVIKITPVDQLIPADWGDSEQLKVGSIVWAIGSPYGLDQTVTSGIISGINRRDEDHRNRELLQTDAAVNPGNSGGPLVDSGGRVIGINTSIFGETFQGISFAVPGAVAKFIYRELMENGEVTRGFLGVRPLPVFQDTAERLSLPDLDGAVIDVDRGTPAYRSGLKDRDVIREWDGHPLSEYHNLYRFVEMTPPYSTVPVKVIRDGREMELDVTVGRRQQ